MLPYIPDISGALDIGTDEDAGFWLAALAFVHFEASDYAPADVTEPLAAIQVPDGEGVTGDLNAGVNFHEGETTND